MKTEHKKVVKLSEDDLLEACAKACTRRALENPAILLMANALENPAILLMANEFARLSAYIVQEVFKED